MIVRKYSAKDASGDVVTIQGVGVTERDALESIVMQSRPRASEDVAMRDIHGAAEEDLQLQSVKQAGVA